MSRRGKSSIVHQTKTAVNAIDKIGYSKRDARSERTTGIHSLKQKQETVSASQNFTKWTRNTYGIRNLYELRDEHYRSYINHMRAKGSSIGHIKNVETSLRHLQKGMAVRAKKFNKEPVNFCPTRRMIQTKEALPKDRSYENDETKEIMERLPSNSRDAVILSRAMGMRVREACTVRVEHFQADGKGGLKLYIRKNEGQGVTKGGRFRETPVPKNIESDVKRMMKGKKPKDTLVSVKRDTVRRAVNRACKGAGIQQNGRGTHGFRHAYARERVDQLLDKQNIKREGDHMIDRIMKNRDCGRAADYGMHGKEQLFNSVKKVIDQVHEEIGHGMGRWDLASVYMRR